MAMRAFSIAGPRLRAALVLGLVGLAVVASIATWQRVALQSDLEAQADLLRGVVSQRADQHDAHMTALSALAVASEGQGDALFLDVAATIHRFYPRIADIALVPLDPARPVTGTAPVAAATAERIRAAARTGGSDIALFADPERAGRYLLVKRSPNSEAARNALVLAIDGALLIEDAGPYWQQDGRSLSLALPDGTPLTGMPDPAASATVASRLNSASQPLALTASIAIGPGQLLPPWPTGLALAGVVLAYLAVLAILRQRRFAQLAIEQSRLSGVEARLAHAMRVNAMGEMASGMAHELTQPLTAILAQVQAGRHLLARGDTAALSGVLEDATTQARRASAILERLRNWSRPQRPPAAPVDLAETLVTVEALIRRKAVDQGTSLAIDLPEEPSLVLADPVEMEQVVFNLVRNALDAVAGRPDGAVTLRLRREGPTVTLDVLDNGPGIAPDLLARLFTPFATTRSDGTGLGLVLSQRLVERAGGEISLLDSGHGAAFRIALPAFAGRGDTP